MNDSENTVRRYLERLELGPIQDEPDGKNSPDFLVDGRIAVEVRRLNENEAVDVGTAALRRLPSRCTVRLSRRSIGQVHR
jgi:hypothetical protein